MALEKDLLLGNCYLSPQDFAKRAAAFGAQLSTVDLSAEALLALLATASRQIETYLGGRTFGGDALTENQPWNERTRRFPLNNPPPKTVTSCKLWVAPGLTQTIVLTPVVQDGAGNEMSWGELIWNRQVNLMEFGGLASSEIAQPVIVIAGMRNPFIEITYQSQVTVPPQVAAACGFQTAHLAQISQANEMLPGGLTSARTEKRSVERRPAVQGDSALDLCPQAKALLRGLVRLVAG